MNDILSCPKPFILNTIKHHFDSIGKLIKQARSGMINEEELGLQIKRVGRSMIDLYHGKLTPGEIFGEIRAHLEKRDFFEPAAYTHFIASSPKQFRNVSLRDGSNWTLLLGYEQGRYIHIHPSRGSAQTMRVGAMALKTAIYLMTFYSEKRNDIVLVDVVNAVRERYLQEAPIKNETYTKGLRRALSLFE